ncbi:MAG: sensor histidine kinase [Chloroflexi bacterium]|nr:sensor histidine kinase [Chloroflexota bacterium]
MRVLDERIRFPRSYLLVSGERNLRQMKALEWIFIAIHSLGIPFILFALWMHHPDSALGMITIIGLLALGNVAAGLLNRRIGSREAQQHLSLASLMGIALVAWALIFEMLHDRNTAAYAGFAVVIVEAAVRFGIVGSLGMGVAFIFGLSGAMAFRSVMYGLDFSVSGYVFWAVLMMLISLVVGLVAEETRMEQRRNKRLAKQTALLEERHRIARDLHDTVLSTLHALAIEANRLEDQLTSHTAKEKVRNIEVVCRRAGQEIRDTIYGLRNEGEGESIFAQIAQMTEVWSESSGIPVELVTSGEDQPLPLLTGYNLRCVLSEALVNVRKHSCASRVLVRATLSTDEMRMEIHDNGRGIDWCEGDPCASIAGERFGILGMRERVEHIGGRLIVESKRGTRLTITVPITATAKVDG